MNKIPNISDVKNFVEGNYNFYTQDSLPTHIVEQVELRKFLCQPCLENKACLHCGCKTPNVFYSPSKIDADNKWGPFMSEIQWNALKNNITEYSKFFEQLNNA